MKILQVTSFFRPSWEAGGIARVCYALSKRLAERGHEVTVYTTDGFKSRVNVQKNCRVFIEGMDVFYFSNMSLFLASRNLCVPYMAPLIARKHMEEFDIIHIHTFRSALAILIWYYANKYGIPYVLQAHGSVLPFFQKQRPKKVFDSLFGYRILKDASKVFALSRMEAEQYRGMGVPEEKIAIIPNGIDLSEYADLPPKGSFKKKFNIDEDEKIVLYLGRIHRIKGIDILVKTFASIVEKLDDVRLVVVGPDDGYLSELEALIKVLKIDDNVLISDPLYGRDKLEAYVDADVCVLPSRYETFPMTILEAVACGTPIILTDYCGITEYFRDKVGLVVKPIPKNLVDALLKILQDEELRDVFRGNCQKVIGEFDVSKTILQLEEVYEAALTSN